MEKPIVNCPVAHFNTGSNLGVYIAHMINIQRKTTGTNEGQVMDVYSTGLSLVLGKALTAWCEQLSPSSLERYLEIGGFQGLRRAAKINPIEVIAELRTSGLRDRRAMAEPVYLSWQRFQQRHTPGTMIVDARHYDPRSQSGAFLFETNPFGLIEGLLIGAITCNAKACKLLLPSDLQEFESKLLNALEIVLDRDLSYGQELHVELVRDPRVSIWSHNAQDLPEREMLIHHLETWYHIVLVFSLGANHYKTLGLEGQTGTHLLTVGGAVKKPGLVEAPVGVNMWHAIEALAGGPADGTKPFAISLDGGMGGFLPAASTYIPLAPEEMSAAGVNPVPMTLWVLEKGACMVDMARRALYKFWTLSEEEDREARCLIARATRMVTELTVGKGQKGHLAELEKVGREMAGKGIAAAWPILSSLTYFPDQWTDHIKGKPCPSARCLVRAPAPCHKTCPSSIDIPSFLALIGHGDYKKAVGIMIKDNPLPYVCGLVCPAPCEQACLRGEMDAPIHIRAMKAVAAKHAVSSGGYPVIRKGRATGKRVAIVGSGPAGLTAAYFLARKGHDVTIFEAQKEAGGMLRYGIPAYRLPREILDFEVGRIAKLGVHFQTGKEIENLDELRNQGFDAAFLGLGTQISRMVPIEGKDLPFVKGGLDFLKEVRNDQDPRVGPKVVVVGGGNVAIDVALTALRQGGKRVDIVCLEKRREMPANLNEIETALAEGVAIHNSWGPVSVSSDHVFTAQRCTRVFDDRGRFSPQFDPERTFSLEADHVILAIGQATDLACVELGSLVEVNRGLICVEEQTLQTREPGIFAGGDVVYGPRTIVEAIRAGKHAAAAIDAYLRGKSIDMSWSVPRRRAEVEPLSVSALERTNLKRPLMPERKVEDRKGNFLHIELGLSDEMAHGESKRCLRCDLCIGCGLCQLVCSEFGIEALRLGETNADRLAFNDFTRASSRCVGCGACANACPTGAIKIVDGKAVRKTVLTGTTIREQELIPCTICGKPMMSPTYMDYLKTRVGPHAVDHVDRNMCAECARWKRARELSIWSENASLP